MLYRNMNLSYHHGYEQESPGWYIVDDDTGLIVSSEDTDPDEVQLFHINMFPHLKDIHNLILRDRLSID